MHDILHCKEKKLSLAQVQVMGILNVTPDSFSDGAQYQAPDAGLTHALKMVEEGASIIDIGGESTRPGAAVVSVQAELDRVCPMIEAIAAESSVIISIDTSKPEVMTAAVGAGAGLINDIRALRMPGALEAAAAADVPICLMHIQGEPATMQCNPHYQDVVQEVVDFLAERIAACQGVGIKRDQLIVDPGFGFGKNLSHNLQLLDQLAVFSTLNEPILVGISRKSMVGQVLDVPIERRLAGSVSSAVIAAMKGAHIVRVHDVGPTVEAIKMVNAVNSIKLLGINTL